MKQYLRYPLFLFGFCLMTTIAAQSSIKGKITNAGKPEEFVNVYLQGTSYGTATDSLGNYTINKIPEGKYKLIANHLN